MKLKLSHILQIVAAAFGVLAIISLFLAGVGASVSQMGVTVSVSISLIGLMFGNGSIKTAGVSVGYKGGMSYFGLIAFILLIVAIVLAIVAVVMKKSNLLMVAGAVAVIAGICVLLVLVAGTKVSSASVDTAVSFKAFMEGLKLGVGTILFAISAILGGGLLVASKVVDNK